MATTATAERVERIQPDKAHRDVDAGDALLVCAYDDEEKFRKYHLDGAMSLAEFERVKDSTKVNKEIIFYCA